MGLIGGFLQAAVDTVSLPIQAGLDVVEGGRNNRTARTVSKIGEDMEDALEGDSFF